MKLLTKIGLITLIGLGMLLAACGPHTVAGIYVPSDNAQHTSTRIICSETDLRAIAVAEEMYGKPVERLSFQGDSGIVDKGFWCDLDVWREPTMVKGPDGNMIQVYQIASATYGLAAEGGLVNALQHPVFGKGQLATATAPAPTATTAATATIDDTVGANTTSSGFDPSKGVLSCTYTMQRGDNLSWLYLSSDYAPALQAVYGSYGAFLSDVKSANNITDPDKIAVGQKIKVVMPLAGPEGYSTIREGLCGQ